ncbi:hypothetical protein NE237_031123 [Protea cynaroides]|uniref:Reverse transcriptase/retrotransposon-derived protein RNase H-like domain-containing protein n=1 Tax=Protea cynaroides TaxID=273540 RepID=A0A9Q0L1T9_9MAGN|nr:hypothetical protein NE237_031123 [Protea cynaroides]
MFIKSYSGTIAPLTNLLKKEPKWQWMVECQRAFDDLKKAVVEEPIMALPNHTKSFKVQINASDFAIHMVLLQDGHLITYENRKPNETERCYTVQEKEMTVVVYVVSALGVTTCWAQTVWSRLTMLPQATFSNRKISAPNKSFAKTSSLSSIWSEYEQGRINQVVDGLSRRLSLLP